MPDSVSISWWEWVVVWNWDELVDGRAQMSWCPINPGHKHHLARQSANRPDYREVTSKKISFSSDLICGRSCSFLLLQVFFQSASIYYFVLTDGTIHHDNVYHLEAVGQSGHARNVPWTWCQIAGSRSICLNIYLCLCLGKTKKTPQNIWNFPWLCFSFVSSSIITNCHYDNWSFIN